MLIDVQDFAPLHQAPSVEAHTRVVGLRMQRFVPAVIVLAAACVGQSVHAQEYFKGKTVTLFAGQPPGGGIDSEMRLVAHYFGKFIPGEPVVIARNMQGAGGLVLGNHLYNVARPDGLTLGMPGRPGCWRRDRAGDVKYDLRKLT
jgi:tripartite-type tricarboxylate transporter receptor subunit TctC